MDCNPDFETILLIFAAVSAVIRNRRNRTRRRTYTRRWYVRPANESREEQGLYDTKYQLLRNRDPEYFMKTVRMDPDTFDILLGKVAHKLEKHSIRMPITPECRLFLTLK